MVIWAYCLDLLEHGFLGKMVGRDGLMDMVDEVVVVKAVGVVQRVFCLQVRLFGGYDGCKTSDRVVWILWERVEET